MGRHEQVTITHDEFMRRTDAHYALMIQNLRYQRALRSIVNVLGPENICACDHDCGLGAEAHDALQTAKRALLEDTDE